MNDKNVQVFYDGDGNAVAVQMPISDYEGIIKDLKESVAAKEAIAEAVKLLQSIS